MKGSLQEWKKENDITLTAKNSTEIREILFCSHQQEENPQMIANNSTELKCQLAFDRLGAVDQPVDDDDAEFRDGNDNKERRDRILRQNLGRK